MTLLLQTDWLLLARRRFWAGKRWLHRDLWGAVGRLDVRKPLHAVVIGVTLAGVVAPVAAWMAENERYRMTPEELHIIERPAPHLMDKLQYDAATHASVFNADGNSDNGNPNDPQGSLMQVGGGGKKQLYTATMPDDPSKGIEVRDNMNKVSVTFRPQLSLLGGRKVNGHVVYPLKDEAGHMVFTPKGNGVKEDIYLSSKPAQDMAEFDYQLDMPKYVQARVDQDGSVGFYTADPKLFGNISIGSEADQKLVDKARETNDKTYLMFKIPAPVVKETEAGTPVRARFHVDGATLGVFVEGLAGAGYPLTIDPTFLISSTSDFTLGSIDDNIDLSQANQIGRFPLSGGSVSGWTTATNLTNGNYDGALVAYNSALYMIGGGNADTGTANLSTNIVKYIKLNSDGSMNGSWTSTSSLNLARQGLVGFGFNGYLYAVGGDDSNNSGNVLGNCTSGTYSGQNCTVEYAKIQSDSSVGSWAPTSGLATSVAYPAGAEYQGFLYVMGGGTGAGGLTSLTQTVQYVRVNADGTVGTWTQITTGTGALATATSRAAGGAYNGYLYMAGGYTLPGGTGTVVATVAVAPILSTGAPGAWTTTTVFPSARRGNGFAVINGYVYVYGGCSSASLPCPNGSYQSDTEYAAINADGTVGQWQRSRDYVSTNPRVGIMSAYYNGNIYFVGGCSNDVGSANIKCTGPGLGNGNGTVYSGFDVVGRFDRGLPGLQTTQPYNNNAATLARMGAQAVTLNGYLYLIGGCSTASCNTTTAYSAVTEYTQIQANGTLGTFNTTTSLNAQTGDSAGRLGASVVAYNNKIFVIGGIERTTPGNADSYRAEVLSATQNSNGTLNAWATETNNLPSTRAFTTAVVWHNIIVVLGGLCNATTVVSGTSGGCNFSIVESTISSNATNNTVGTWAAPTTTKNLNNVRWGHSGGIWGNWIYVVGGQSTAPATGTYITTANATEQLTISNSGDITADTTQNVTGAFSTRLMGGFVEKGVLYTFGGYTSGSTSAVATINWSALNPSTGVPGAWSSSNIGNNPPNTAGLATARGVTTAVTANGMAYVLGGCSATLVATSFGACGTFVTTTNTTEANLINNGGTGQANSFTAPSTLATGLMPTVNSVAGRADHMSVAYNGELYIIGGCFGYTSGACTNNDNQTDVEGAPINPDGSLGQFTTTGMTQLSSAQAVSLGGAVAYNGYLYVMGGLNNGSPNVASTNVLYAPISSSGGIGSWSAATSLPAARYDIGVAIARGYIYVAGGKDSGGSRSTTIYYTKINTDGTLTLPSGSGCSGTAWCSSSSAVPTLPTARSGISLVSYNGALYAVGGTDSTGTLAEVQYATTSSTDGSLSSWTYATDVSRGATSRQAVGSNGYMYLVGNEGSGMDAGYVEVNANSTLGSYQMSANSLASGHAHGALALYNGLIYVTGGCTLSSGTCGTIVTSNTTEYAGLAGIARIGHYSKLFSTQIDTAPSQLSVSGSLSGPGSVITAKFYTATSSFVFGKAQVISPMLIGNFYLVQALDSSGTNIGVATYYLIVLALDDSNSGTFPDVSTAAETTVNTVTLYYHANPGRRLRHGASFTDTGCSGSLGAAAGCLLDTAP